MARPRHVLETYIKATPEQIWLALTDPERTRQYYVYLAVHSGWEPGSTYSYDGDHGLAIEGTIEECDPPRRLLMTYRLVFTPELAAEHQSRVTWEITSVGDACRVTLVHGDPGLSPVTWLETATGWGIVMAGLKSVVETGTGMGTVPDDGRSPFARNDTDTDPDPDQGYHRALGIEANSDTWNLLGRTDRTPDDDARMVHVAHASAHHLGHRRRRHQLGAGRVPVQPGLRLPGAGRARALPAERCATHVATAGLTDFDLAYAHEARARALACAGRLDDARRTRPRGRHARRGRRGPRHRHRRSGRRPLVRPRRQRMTPGRTRLAVTQ